MLIFEVLLFLYSVLLGKAHLRRLAFKKEHTVTEHGGRKPHMGKVTIFQNKATSAALVIRQYPSAVWTASDIQVRSTQLFLSAGNVALQMSYRKKTKTKYLVNYFLIMEKLLIYQYKTKHRGK